MPAHTHRSVFCALATALLALALSGCGQEQANDSRATPERSATDPHLTARSYPTWDAFLGDNAAAATPRNRVIFIGIDGAAWNVIDPMIADGTLPTFERLKRDGRYGTLRSTACYVSPPAWAALTTGYLPERSGIYTFGVWNSETQAFRSVSADDFRKPALWDAASRAGRRTAVVNVPVTYPVREVNGIMLSGLLTPVKLDDEQRYLMGKFDPVGDQVPGAPRSYSPVIGSGVRHEGNEIECRLIDTADDGRAYYDLVHLTVRAGDDAKPTVHQFPFGAYSDWVKIAFQSAPGYDQGWCKFAVGPSQRPGFYTILVSRVLFSYTDANIPFAYPDSLVDDMSERFPHYFPSTYMDGPVLPAITEESAARAFYLYQYDDWDLFFYVFTQTDNIHHAEGMTPTTQAVYQSIDRFLGYLIDRMPPDCTLIIASDHGFKSYAYNIDLNRLLESMGLLRFAADTAGGIDYDHSLVFHNLWHLYYNDALMSRDELARHGIPCPDGTEPRDALTDYLTTALRESLATKYGTTVPIEVTALDTRGPNEPAAAVKGTYGDYKIEFWNLRELSDAAVTPLNDAESNWFHTRDGIYVVYGAAVAGGGEGEPRDIQDIAPTIQYLLNVPVAPDVDGRVMTPLLRPELVADNTQIIVDAYDWDEWRAVATDEDREDLEKKLKSLGYVR